jgi:hypothetical protein
LRDIFALHEEFGHCKKWKLRVCVYKESQRILFTKEQKRPLVELMQDLMFVVQDPENKLN